MFEFVDIYNEARKKSRRKGQISRAVADRINASVVAACEEVGQYCELEDAYAEFEASITDRQAYNDEILESEGFTRNDWINGRVSGYVERCLVSETGDWPDHEKNKRDMESAFFESVYAVDAVLTSDTRRFLGREYEIYAVQREAAMNAECFACDPNIKADREARSMNGQRNVYFDVSDGSYHNSVLGLNGCEDEDPFSFDD